MIKHALEQLGQRMDTLDPEYYARLEKLGFVWNVAKHLFDEGFQYLVAYKEEYGDLLVPNDYKTKSGYKLGQWVANIRPRIDRLTPENRARLDELGFIWKPKEFMWEQGFQHLVAYKEEHGDVLVPISYETPSGFKLGRWIDSVRHSRVLGEDRIKRINELGFVWNVNEHRWEQGFQHFVAYKEEHGDLPVPNDYKTKSGYKLGQWVNSQRSNAKKGQLSSQRIKRLNELKFVWRR